MEVECDGGWRPLAGVGDCVQRTETERRKRKRRVLLIIWIRL